MKPKNRKVSERIGKEGDMFGIDDAIVAAVAPSAIGAAKSLFSRQSRTRKPTELINLYSRMKKEGKYSPAAMSSIMGRAGGEAGNVEQQTVADMQGRLEASGMGGSIAGNRLLAMPGMQRMRSLADLSGNLTAENEASKVEASQNLAELTGNYEQARDDENSARRNSLVGGLTDAAGAGFMGYTGQKELGETEDWNKLHTGIRSYILGGGDIDSEDFASMFEKVYGMKWPGKRTATGSTSNNMRSIIGEDYQ